MNELHIIYILSGTIVLLLLIGAVSWVRAKIRALQQQLLSGLGAGNVQTTLPVLQTSTAPQKPSCGNCAHFSLEGGQAIMRCNPAFLAAAEHLQPWQMGRPVRTDPNPAYLELEKRVEAAGAAGDKELEQKLQNELMTMNPGEQPPDPVPAELLELTWDQFGACGAHQELRPSIDHCDRWAPRS